MLKNKFGLRTLNINIFCLGSGIQDQHYLPAFQPVGLQAYPKIAGTIKKWGKNHHGDFILNKLLGKLVFFFSAMFVFYTMMLE